MNKVTLQFIGPLLLTISFGLVNLTNSQIQSQPQQQLATSPCPFAIKINTNYFRNSLHFVCLQAVPAAKPRLDVINFNTRQILYSWQVEDLETNQLASFVDDQGTLRILLAVPTKENGTSMYSLNYDGTDTRELHTINSQKVDAISIWRLDLNLVWHLAIANQPILLPNKPDLKPIISIHHWRSTYFDRSQMITSPYDGRITRIEPMNIMGQEFLILTLDPNQPKMLRNQIARSLIYKLDFSDTNLNWFLYQELDTNFALDVRSFVVTHKASLRTDYYLAVLGQINERDIPDYVKPQRSGYYGLIIYKYMGDQFQVTDFVSLPGASRLEAVSYGSGDTYVIIGVLYDQTGQVNLFLYDGLKTTPISVPNLGPGRAHQGNQRGKRTMPQANLHLFLAPPERSTLTDMNETTQQRRTLIGEDDSIQTAMPTLLISKPRVSSNTNSNSSDTQIVNFDSVFKIPVEEAITENEKQLNLLQPETGASSPNQESAQGRKRKLFGSSYGQEMLTWCNSNIRTLLNDTFNMMSTQIHNLPRVDQLRPIEINGDLIIDNNLMVSNILYTTNIRERSDLRSSFIPATSNFSHIFEQIQDANNEIDYLKRRVDQILVDDGSKQLIFNPITFDTINIQCLTSSGGYGVTYPSTCPIVNEIRTPLLNSRDISNIREQALLTGRTMVITSDVRFEHLVLRGNVDILDTLNGISIQDIVFKIGPTPGIPIHGHKNFRNNLYSASDLIVDQWNNFRIDRDNYLISSGSQDIETNLRVDNIVLDSSGYNLSSRIERLNGIHLDMHLSAIAMGNERETVFEVPVYFDEMHLNGPIDLKTQSLLSNINIDELWLTTMFKHSNQKITAPIDFAGNVHITNSGEMVLDGLMNNVDFKPKFIMMRNRDYKLKNPIIVEGDLTVGKLHIMKALNEIQVVSPTTTGINNNPELSILMDKGEQMITVDKVFNEIHLGGDSTIGNINGHLNLSELYSLTNNGGAQHNFDVIRLTGRNINIANGVQIHIDNTINDIPVNNLCSLAKDIGAQGPNYAIRHNRLRFGGPLRFKSLRCGSVNGFHNLTQSFLTKSGNQYVAGTLNLVGGVDFNTTIDIQSSFNDMPISPLANAVEKSINDTRTGVRDFYGDLHLEDLITDKINDLNLRNIFVAKSDIPQIVRNRMVFKHLDIENVLIVRKNLQTNSFNNLNISNIFHNTLQYDKPQTILNHIDVDTLHLMPGSHLHVNSLNGYNLRMLYEDAVQVDVQQMIIGPKTFKKPVEFTNSVHTNWGIDNINNHELRYNMLLHSDELIEGDIEFDNDVYVKKELEILSNIINDIDISVFRDRLLYERNKNESIRLGGGPVRFEDVRVNNMMIGGTIQNIDFSQDAILRNDPGYNVSQLEQKVLAQQQAWDNQRKAKLMHNQKLRVPTTTIRKQPPSTCIGSYCPKTTMKPPYFQQPNYVTARPRFFSPPHPQMAAPFQVPFPPAEHLHYIPMRYYQPTNHSVSQIHYPTTPIPQSLVHVSDNRYIFQPLYQQGSSLPQNQKVVNTTYQLDERNPVLEYQNTHTAYAIRDLAPKINKFLLASFFYEIAHKHPEIGPLLDAVESPSVPSEMLLLSKATGGFGEPCLKVGQSIAVSAQQPRAKPGVFMLNSRITETSNPIATESLVLEVGPGNRVHYLIVLDRDVKLQSRILVFVWSNQMGRYMKREVIEINGLPTKMKVFNRDNFRIGCIAFVTGRMNNLNDSGAPIIYCQKNPMGNFKDERIRLDLQNVFNLDVVPTAPQQIVIATLSEKSATQIGTLSLHGYDFISKSLKPIVVRRFTKPTNLRFFFNGPRKQWPLRLVVTEAITSNDDERAITRIFSIVKTPVPGYPVPSISFEETQIIRDNQFNDIQTVQLDSHNSLLFFQSDNFISVYAPTGIPDYDHCMPQYSLVARLPTRGTNRFLVFNQNPLTYLATNIGRNVSIQPSVNNSPYRHFLVLTSDACDEGKYSTLILRSVFN